MFILVSCRLDKEFDLRISPFPALRLMCEYLIYLKLFLSINHQGWWWGTVRIIPLATLQQTDMKHVMSLEVSRQFQPVCDRYSTYLFNHFQWSHLLHQQFPSSNIPQWNDICAQQHLITHIKFKKGYFLINISFLCF